MSLADSVWLDALRAKVAAGEPLDEADVARLAQPRHLLGLGVLAEAARQRRHGPRVTFVRVAELRVGEPPAPPPPTAHEVRVVGQPSSIEAACAAIRAARALAGETPVTGLALHDLARLCGGDAARLYDSLCQLREAGLALLAEAAVDRLPDPRPLEVAAQAGVRIARLTRAAAAGQDALEWIWRVAAWGSLASVAHAVAPLPHDLGAQPPSTGYDDVRQIALARVLLRDVASIQVDWTLYGPKLAQVALLFGADDLDNVSPVEATLLGPRRAVVAEVRRNIQAAALEPVERDGAFRLLSS
jgi:hypothetical protein